MKSMFPRAVLALLCAVILSACGGGGGTMYLQVTVSGLAKDGLVLVNKSTGEKLPVPSGTTTILFTKLIAIDEQFNIAIDTQPTGAICTAQTSTGLPTTGSANGFNVYDNYVTCKTNPYTLGGVVKGLTSSGLVLANGPDTIAVLPSATTPGADVNFTFKTMVGDGGAYGVTVLTQPASQACTVTNPTGNMGSTNNLTLNVVCQ